MVMSDKPTKVKRYKMFFENHPVWSKIILISGGIICLGLIFVSFDNIITISKKYVFKPKIEGAKNKPKIVKQTTIKKQELNKIYQDNKVVGEIIGKVNILNDNYILFEELSETFDLKINIPFEYQEVKYIIKKHKKLGDLVLKSKSRLKHHVLTNVLCKKFK